MSPKYSAALRQTTANVDPALGRAEEELQLLKEKLKEAEKQVSRRRVSYGGMGSLRAERPRQRCLLRPPAPERRARPHMARPTRGRELAGQWGVGAEGGRGRIGGGV